jgi:hypothetical protein
MAYFISKFTIDFVFIISKFVNSTYILLNNPIINLLQKYISFNYKKNDSLYDLDDFDDFDDFDDYEPIKIQETFDIIIQNKINTFNIIEVSNKINIDIESYGWFIYIE